MQDSHDGVSIQISGCSDVVTLQVPRLELWFGKNSHPSHSAVAAYTDTLNKLPYRSIVFLFETLGENGD